MDIPRELHMSLIKLQAEHDLDYDEACVRASRLLDANSREFKLAVEKEVGSIKRGLMLSESNRFKKTWKEQGYEEGYGEGDAAGYSRGAKEHKIVYPCSVCGREIIMLPDGPDHRAMKDMMKERGWAHGDCVKKGGAKRG